MDEEERKWVTLTLCLLLTADYHELHEGILNFSQNNLVFKTLDQIIISDKVQGVISKFP